MNCLFAWCCSPRCCETTNWATNQHCCNFCKQRTLEYREANRISGQPHPKPVAWYLVLLGLEMIVDCIVQQENSACYKPVALRRSLPLGCCAEQLRERWGFSRFSPMLLQKLRSLVGKGERRYLDRYHRRLHRQAGSTKLTTGTAAQRQHQDKTVLLSSVLKETLRTACRRSSAYTPTLLGLQ